MLPSKSQNTRQEIIDAATRLLIEEGAGGFSVRKVAQGAAISLGNLQYHFPTKNDLFYGLFEQVKDRVIAVAGTEQDEESQFFAYVDAIFEEWDTAAGSIPVWELGSMAAHDEDLAEMLHNLYAPFRKRLARIIARNNPRKPEIHPLSGSSGAVRLPQIKTPKSVSQKNSKNWKRRAICPK
jgi:AcrR family transcriptional regulator